MSMNLHLASIREDGSLQKRCDLFQTPTAVTSSILEDEQGLTQSRYAVMLSYFEWVDKFLKKEPGHALDHKLYVAMFLVKYPGAHWYSG